MAYVSQSRQLLKLVVLALLLLASSVASPEVESQWNLANDNVMKVERNATIEISPGIAVCGCHLEGPLCHKYLRNNFTLAPEVCLSGFDLHYMFVLLEMPKCVSRDGETPAVLITYADEKCTGPAMVQTRQSIRDYIQFPNRGSSFTVQRWSLIFHCHSEPFDEVLDPFKRVYINGERLQDPPDPPISHGPFGLCEPWPRRLTYGSIQFISSGCTPYISNIAHVYDLPTDICQSTSEAKAFKINTPGICPDGSRARMAQFWDEECKDLHVINDIKDEDLA